MKIKDQNSGYTWPSRVREYDAIPGRTISSKESWEKIRERLDQAPIIKKRSFYWLAAASVLFIVIMILFMPVTRKSIEPRFTKTQAVPIQDKNIFVPGDTMHATGNALLQPSNWRIKRAGSGSVAILQEPATKEDSVLASPGERMLTSAGDTSATTNDLAQHPIPLPSVHINDLDDAEPMAEHITLRGLAMKKMIRLFGIDVTKVLPPKNQGKIPANPDTIPPADN